MRKRLASGTLWWLLKEMPMTLQVQLNDDLERIDSQRRERHRQGDTKLVSLSNHLRWVTEHQADLGDMKLKLFGVLVNYLPITLDHMLKNELPTLSDCSYFWGRQIKYLEKESAKVEPIAA